MKKSVVRRVLKYIKPYKGLLALAILSAIISVSLTLYIPVLTGNAIDNIIAVSYTHLTLPTILRV